MLAKLKEMWADFQKKRAEEKQHNANLKAVLDATWATGVPHVGQYIDGKWVVMTYDELMAKDTNATTDPTKQ